MNIVKHEENTITLWGEKKHQLCYGPNKYEIDLFDEGPSDLISKVHSKRDIINVLRVKSVYIVVKR